MPHKRAKKSARDQMRNDKGFDHTPASSSSAHPGDSSDFPKAMARVLNAEKVQAEWRERKRKRELEEAKREVEGEGPIGKKLKIKPGEHIRHFNQRVEDDMRGIIREATVQSKRKTGGRPKNKQKKKSKGDAHSEDEDDVKQSKAVDKEFAKAPSIKRVHDVVQAPPVFNSLPRHKIKNGGKNDAITKSRKDLPSAVLTLAQKQLMMAERDKVVGLYREMKERQRRGE